MTHAHVATNVRPHDVPDWDQFVASCADAGPMHWAGWWRVLAEGFAVQPRYLRATDTGGATLGVLPLYESRSVVAGRHLASLAGGALARDPAVAAALVERARDAGAALGARYVLVRGGAVGRGATRIAQAVHTAVDLTDGADLAFSRLSSNTRRKVRKAGKSGFEVAEVRSFATAFYPVYARNLHDLGTPVPARALFDGIERHLGERWRFLAIAHRGRAAGGMVLMESPRGWSSLYVAIPRDSLRGYPTYLLYWRAMELAASAGAPRFDFGRSVRGGGTHAFKQQFGRDVAVPYAVYQHSGRAAAALRSGDGALSRAWRRLPLWLANAAGPIVRRSLPFA